MNLPVQFSTDATPAVPQQFLAQFQLAAQQMTQGFGASFNRIRPGTATFTLIEGGNTREVNNGQVAGVLLGIAPYDHCTWYEKDYVPGQEPEAPDLVWEWKTPDTFPAALPAKYRKKTMVNGKERWKFQIARRSVWALVKPDANGQPMLDLDNPYILDMTSMSLYGKGNPQAGTFKYTGLVNFCKSFSSGPVQIVPSMFVTQILLDTAAKLAGVVVFKPMLDQSGRPQYLDAATFDSVINTMFSQTVQDALKVQEKLEWPVNSTASTVATNPSATTAPVTPVASPVTASPVAPSAPSTVTSSAPSVRVNPAPQPQPVQPVAPIAPAAATAPTAQPSAPAAPVQPAAPQPEAMSNEALMAQAAQVLNNPHPVQTAAQPAQPVTVAPGVNETTGAAINALAGLFN